MMASELESEMENYNKVKDLVLDRLVEENLLDKDDADEFRNRCQVLVYKGKWFSKWFEKNLAPKGNKMEGYYMRIIDMCKKEDDLERLMRRTTGDYNE